jgi:hypothetical protein
MYLRSMHRGIRMRGYDPGIHFGETERRNLTLHSMAGGRISHATELSLSLESLFSLLKQTEKHVMLCADMIQGYTLVKLGAETSPFTAWPAAA